MLMTQSEWIECQETLSDRWPGHRTFWEGDRFRSRWVSVPYRAMLSAIEACIDDSHSAPTVNAIAGKLPRGYKAKRSEEEHAHGWQEVAGAIMCDCGKHDRMRCQCELCTCTHENAVQDSDHHDEWWFCHDCNAAIKMTRRRGGDRRGMYVVK